MKESIKKQPIKEPEEGVKEPSVLEEKEFRKFIKEEEISSEDFKIIKDLSHFPKNFFFVEFHNFFNLNRYNSEEILEQQIKDLEEYIEKVRDERQKSFFEKKKEFFELFLKITQKYDWKTSWWLTRLFERRKP